MPGDTPSSLTAGQKVGAGRFTLVRELGRGGMGEVWLARDEKLSVDAALKFLAPDISADAAKLNELRGDTLNSRRLTHPNIVRIQDWHEIPGEFVFIEMEYVDGHSLTWLRLQQPHKCLTWEFLRPLVIQLCQALEYAHGEKVIHCDLKPSNLVMDGRGRLKIADFGFGAARISLSGDIAGIQFYLSPQQLRGEPPQVTDDIYALGATLYELLTSKPPFYLADPLVMLNEPAPPLEQRLAEAGITNAIPASVSATIMACLSKDAAHRPQSAQAVLEKLLDFSPPDGEPAADPIAIPAEEAQPPKSTASGGRGLKVAWLCFLTFCFAGVLGYWMMKSGVMNSTVSVASDRLTNSLGQVFVPVPGTKVLFNIWDTRVQDFEAFVKATGYDASAGMVTLHSAGWTEYNETPDKPGFAQGPTHPICGVSWNDAHAFCKWLTEKERANGGLKKNQSYRLPTDAEWSTAAGDGLYSWGSEWPPPEGAGNFAGEEAADDDWPLKWDTLAYYKDGYARTSPVGSFRANKFGLYDLGGNLWQWNEDAQQKDAKGGQPKRLLRGGSWRIYQEDLLRTKYHNYNKPGYRSADVGFRCVLATDDAAQ